MTAEQTPAVPPPAGPPLDPLGDVEALSQQAGKHNRAKVGAHRPSALLYSYGPGAIIDLPNFTVMPSGLDDWEPVWRRSTGDPPPIHAPRLRDAVRRLLGSRDLQLRAFPRAPKTHSLSQAGKELGVPARVFPQWLRCTGCDMLAPLSSFRYDNTHPWRTDEAKFTHAQCHGRSRGRAQGRGRAAPRTAVPARYLLACPDGHLDEFPYELWVHQGRPCAAQVPRLKMVDRTAGKGASATIECASCSTRRGMNEAQGEAGRDKLPPCRGRHPHLDIFQPCGLPARLMLVGASNLWFPATQSVVVMPGTRSEQRAERAEAIRAALGPEKLTKYAAQLEVLRDLLDDKEDVTDVSDADLGELVAQALAVPTEEPAPQEWDPIDLLVPEWTFLQQEPGGPKHDDDSGLVLSPRLVHADVRRAGVGRVLSADRLRKVNALVGFTPHRRRRAGCRPGCTPRAVGPRSHARMDRRHRGPRRGDLPAARRSSRRSVGAPGARH